MSLLLPAGPLAKGWLAVAAASTKSNRPALDRTVFVEQFAHGLRLTATDTYILLTTWIPAVGADLEPDVSIDEVPLKVAVAHDVYGRGAGLLSHLLRLARADEEEHQLDLDVMVRLNVPWQSDTDDLQLDGFGAQAVTVEHPGSEKVQLPVYEGEWPDYRQLLRAFRMQRPMALAVSQHVIGRVAKSAKVFGAETVISQRFGGADKAMLVTYGFEPSVTGLVMPVRWDFERNVPWGHDDETPADDEPEPEAAAVPELVAP